MIVRTAFLPRGSFRRIVGPPPIMANAYYQPGEERALKVQDLFSQIARRYDLINDLQSFGLHRYWKRAVLRLCRLDAGEPALDVCCGTGDLTRALARGGGKVVGLDFNSAMLEVARSKPALAALPEVVGVAPGAGTIEYLCGDALHLPFPDASFAVVTMGYGLRNLADFRRGVAELARVLRPGGRLVILDFGKPSNPLWRACYFQYLRWVVPVFGRWFCRNPDAYSYILESLLHYPAQQGVDALLREAGLVNTRVHDFLGGVMGINYAERSGVPLVSKPEV